MAIEIPMMRDGNRLRPVDQIGEEDLQRVKPGKQYMVRIVAAPKTANQMRFIRALAAKVAGGCGWLADATEATDYLKLKAGFFKVVKNKEGDMTFLVPKSYDDVDDVEEFSRLIDKMIHIICTEILPDFPAGQLRREVERMVKISDPEPAEVRHTSNGPDGEGARQVTPRPQTP